MQRGVQQRWWGRGMMKKKEEEEASADGSLEELAESPAEWVG